MSSNRLYTSGAGCSSAISTVPCSGVKDTAFEAFLLGKRGHCSKWGLG